MKNINQYNLVLFVMAFFAFLILVKAQFRTVAQILFTRSKTIVLRILPLAVTFLLLTGFSFGQGSVQTIPVGSRPYGIAFDGANMWVVNHNCFQCPGSVTKIRVSDGANLGTFPVGLGPVFAAFDGANIWIANRDSSNVTKLRASDGAVLGTFAIPGAQWLAFDGANIWVTNGNSSSVTKLRPIDGAILAVYPTGFRPAGVVFDGSNIWTANFGANTVSKLRASDGMNLGTFPVGIEPANIGFDGTNVWVANEQSASVTKLRASDGANLGTFSVGGIPKMIAFDGNSVWVANGGSNTVTKLRASDGAVLATTNVGANPWGIASDGNRIWVSNNGTNTVSIITEPTCTPQAPGLLGWWSGEGNGLPEVGSNVAVLGNGAQYGLGQVGQAFQFDGINDYVDIGSFGVLPTYTVALWFNADVVDRNRTFISQDRAGYNDDFMLGIEPEGDFYGNDFRRITVVFHDNATQTRSKIRDTVDTLPGRWYFVAVTYDGMTMRLWVDGVEKGSVTMTGLATSDQRWNLGQNSHYFPFGSYRNYAGRIDEPIIAGRAFTQSEINSIYLAGQSGICKDTPPPVTSTMTSPEANSSNWNNTDVNVSFTADDDSDGTGVKNITYNASGAQNIAPTTVNGSAANLTITAEGETTITYFAEDNAGNVESAQTLFVKIDKTAPVITSQATAGGNPYTVGTWTNQDVIVSFDCNDSLSGVASVTPPVTLSNEGANQSANGGCTDVAGNSANTSFSDIDIDKTAPTISITSPTNGNYLLNQAVTVNFSCSDSLSGVAICSGTTANGGQLDTTSIGAKIFTVLSTDNAGNSASPTIVNYTIAFGIVALFDQTKAHKSGSTVPIKIKLVDAGGVNASSAATVVHAVSVIQINSQASPTLEDPGNSNPDFDFRYVGDSDGGSYHFNLKTTGYGTGTHQLNFTAGNGSTIYFVQFQIRQ